MQQYRELYKVYKDRRILWRGKLASYNDGCTIEAFPNIITTDLLLSKNCDSGM